jgi:ribonucleotide reductase alpha subunit
MSIDIVFDSLVTYTDSVDSVETVVNPVNYVIKRKGFPQPLSIEKIYKRVQYLADNPTKLEGVNVKHLCDIIINKLEENIKTQIIDEFTADQSISMVMDHLDYGTLAGRIAINNHHKMTRTSFRDKMEELYLRNVHGMICSLISDKYYKFVLKNQRVIEEYIDYDRDYWIDYFGFKTLEKSYLLKVNGKVVERPQDLFMRTAIFTYMSDEYFNEENLEKIFKTYDLYSKKMFSQATPTWFNSGGLKPQLFSCFLLGSHDSQDGINKTYCDMGKISKWAGGLGVHVSSFRATGSLIRSTNGPAAGIIPIMQSYNACVRLYNQGGKRPGHAAMYIEPHHPDIFKFLMLKRNHGSDEVRARSLFYALWLSDLFMERLKNDDDWSLFCPDECPGLNDVWGDEYKRLYLRYEADGKAKEVVKPRDILSAAYDLMKEQGVPYIGFKDTVNRYNMQSNVGIIRSSNLCVSGDTLIWTDHGETPIKDLISARVHNVWNGTEFTPAVFAKTSDGQKVIKITFKEANMPNIHYFNEPRQVSITCTPYHEFVGYVGNNVDAEKIQAKDLKIGSYLKVYDLPDRTSPEWVVVNIEDLNDEQPTYCFHEPKNNLGTFNGIVTGQCIEIQLYSDDKNYAVCCLGNIVLPNYVRDTWSKQELELPIEQRRKLNDEFPVNPVIIYKEIVENAGNMVENLDKLLDKNYYPVIETVRSAFHTRAIGIGVQGLADVFLKCKIPFESPAAAEINKKIFEAIYYGALSRSNDLCYKIYKNIRKQIKDHGYVEWSPIPAHVLEKYPTLYSESLYLKYNRTYNNVNDVPKTIGAYPAYLENGGSPLANGKFHWELYDAKPSGMFDWESLREKIKVYGVRHSHVTAAMPTATTSQIMGYVESFEPYKSNIYMRKTQAGEFPVINKYLYNDLKLINYNLNKARDWLLVNDGSIQNMPNVPAEIKAKYKTAYEMKMKNIIHMARDRQPFVDQSQSMNLFFNRFTIDGHFYKCLMCAWESKLKTGSYYIRTKAASKAQNISIDPDVEREIYQSILRYGEDEEEEICTSCQ